MSADGIVIICHDNHLKRLYGVNKKVSSLPWRDGLDQLRTIREPHRPMLTFRQFLHKVVSTESGDGLRNEEDETRQRTAWKDAWILMDIKVEPHWYL